MNTFSDDHRNMTKSHRENERDIGQASFAGIGIAALALGIFIIPFSTAGIIPAIFGIGSLIYTFTYYK